MTVILPDEQTGRALDHLSTVMLLSSSRLPIAKCTICPSAFAGRGRDFREAAFLLPDPIIFPRSAAALRWRGREVRYGERWNTRLRLPRQPLLHPRRPRPRHDRRIFLLRSSLVLLRDSMRDRSFSAVWTRSLKCSKPLRTSAGRLADFTTSLYNMAATMDCSALLQVFCVCDLFVWGVGSQVNYQSASTLFKSVQDTHI